MAIPSSRVIVNAEGLPLIAQSADQVYLCVGPATAGPLMEPRLVQYDALTETFKGGPAVKAGAYTTSRTNAPVIFVRVPATARAASFDVRLGEWSGAADIVASVAGAPTNFALVVVKTIATGTTGTTGITYQVSVDGGVTFGDTTALLTGLTIVVNGVTITLVTAKSFAGSFSVMCIPASATLYGSAVTKDGASGTMAFSGTPVDQYELIWEIVTAGTAGTGSKITARYSLDGGRSYSAEKRMGDSLTMDLVDYIGTGFVQSTGITLTLQDTEPYKAGDVIVARTTPPEAQASDVLLAIAAVEAEQQFAGKYGFIHAVGNLGRFADANSFQGTLTTLADSSDPAFTGILSSARDQGTGEPDAEWEATVAAINAGLECDRVFNTSGYARITDPCGGHFLRRPVSFRVAERLIARPIAEALHDFSAGPVDDADIFDEAGNVTEHDARNSSTLHDARYITMRTRKGRGGVYFTSSKTLAAPVAPGSVGFDNVPYRRIMDIASAVQQATGEDQLGRRLLFINKTTGLPDEAGAISFDSLMSDAIESAIGVTNGSVAQGALGVQARLSRTTPITGANAKLKTEVRILLLGFVGSVESRIALVRKL